MVKESTKYMNLTMNTDKLISRIIVFLFCCEIPHFVESFKPISRACIPKPRRGTDQYIVGYGSLMSTPSKSRTYPNTLENIPVTVKGFSRSWNCKGVSPTLSTTYLGANWDPKKSFNAVIFKLANSSGADAEKALNDFDRRESYYCRKEVPVKDIQFFGGIKNVSSSAARNSQYWIYVTKPEYTAFPSKNYPIVQSYVDVWLSGCFELEEKFDLEGFAKQCIESTQGWSNNWVNDRIYPRRPFFYQPNALTIDRLLMETIPSKYSKINNGGRINVGDVNVLLALFGLVRYFCSQL